MPMSPSKYAALCAVLCGLGNLIVYTGYEASVFISESVLHSVNGRQPERIGAHDGYYGQAVSNAFYMMSTLAVPSLMNYFRSKYILALSGAFFTFYFLTFQCINRFLYFIACAVLGMASSTFNVGYAGYLTEFSTRQTIERNQALSWAVSCLSVFGAGLVNFIVTTINLDESGIVSKYREYSENEIRYFFAVFAFLAIAGLVIFTLLPNREVKDNIAASNVRCKSIKEQLAVMFSVLFHKRVLILVPFYLYVGMFFSFWVSIIPTALQFTEVLSRNVYIPAYFAFAFTAGSLIMSILTMLMSKIVHNFSFKPQMIINAVLHIMIYGLTVCLFPQWSTVRPNDEPSLLIQPSLVPVLVLAFLFGLADAANYITRNVISSLLIPSRRQQMFGASRFYHGLAASVLFFASPSLSIYAYVIIMSIFLIIATISYLYTCEYIQKEEERLENGTASIGGRTEDDLYYIKLGLFLFDMFLFRPYFWVPVAIITLPSSVLLLLLVVAIIKGQRSGKYNFLVYRVIVVQGILQLLLLSQYLTAHLLIEDRLLPVDLIMRTNGSVFPPYYYHVLVYYFLHVQIWGVVELSFIPFLHLCAPSSFVAQKLTNPGYLSVLAVNILVPAAISAREFFQDTISFVIDKEGNAVLSIPPQVVKSNTTQSSCVAATATIFCVVCYLFATRKLVLHGKSLKNRSIVAYRDHLKITAMGLVLFITQCLMTAYYAIVMLNPEIVAVASDFYIYLVLLMVFIHPWMLTFMKTTLRRRMFGR